MSYRSYIDQSPMLAAMHLDAQPPSQSSSLSLSRVASELEKIASSFDDEYAENTRTVSETTDLAAFVHTGRKQKTEAALADLQVSMQAAREAALPVEQRDTLDRLAEQMHTIDEKQQALLLQAERQQDNINALHSQKHQCDRELAALSEKRKLIAKNTAETLPTLCFVRKLYRGLSHVTFHRNSPPNIITGFISKPDKKDLEPFHCDLSKPPYEYVNQVWHLIPQ